MSNLYIRVKVGFYSHRKTARLRSIIGDDAFWVPPRLWAYAAEHQPDGDLSSYSSEELAMLLGCSRHATSIRQALLDAGFLDGPGIVHDWEEHNGFHKVYSERAKIAAEARWAGKKEKKQKKELKEKDMDKDKETSIALPLLEQCLKHPWVIPASLSIPPFRTTWDQWIRFRLSKKKPADPFGMFQEQLDWLGEFTNEVATEVLKKSIRNDWQGLFPPTQTGTPQGNGKMPAGERREIQETITLRTV